MLYTLCACLTYRTTLAAIWLGNITMWDDEAIQELNTGIKNELPHHNITLAYEYYGFLDITNVGLLLSYLPSPQSAWSSLTPVVAGLYSLSVSGEP